MRDRVLTRRPRSILFICASNVCRGPMAAALLKRRKLDECGRIVRSAGISGIDGRPVLPMAQEVVYKRGIDLSRHRARMATRNLLPGFDLILAMESAQLEWIKTNVPAVYDRTYLLGHWENREIRRPINGHHPEYERVADEIEQYVSTWTLELLAMDEPRDTGVAGRKAGLRSARLEGDRRS